MGVKQDRLYRRSPLIYLPHIDGLRAIAVLPVLAFHLDAQTLPGGFLGVDVFFVISGYLITSIIYFDMTEQRFSFRKFWTRRIRRIFPVVGTMIAASLAAFALLGFPNSVPEHAKSGLFSLLMVVNFHYALNFGNYWGAAAESSPFLHMWSLAVEEQFYLFFPMFLFVLHRFWTGQVVGVIAMLALASLGLFVVLALTSPTLAFYMLPTRAWELGLGCLLAALSLGAARKAMVEAGVLLGLGLIATGYMIPAGGGVSILGSLAVVAGAGLIIKLGRDSIIAASVLANPVMVWIGKLSFSLYVWHWPVIVLAKQIETASGSKLAFTLQLAIIAALSVASYRLVEMPVRNAEKSLAFSLSFLLVGTTCAAWLLIFWAPPVAQPKGYKIPRYAGPFYDISPLEPEESVDTLAKRAGIAVLEREDRAQPFWNGIGVLEEESTGGPRVMLLGDSHALMWAPFFSELAQTKRYDTLISGMTVTPAYLDFVDVSRLSASERATRLQRRKIAENRRAAVEFWKPDLVVATSRAQPSDAILDAFVAYFNDRDIPVLFLGPPPVFDFGNKGAHHMLRYVERFRTLDPKAPVAMNVTDEHETKMRQLEALVTRCNNCYLFDTSSYLLLDKDQAKIADQRIVLYYDDDHLSTDGALLIGPALEQRIAELVAK